MKTSALPRESFGINDPTVTDAEVASRLIKNIPEGTYSWIRVISITSYVFPQSGTNKPARMIHLQPTSIESLLHIIQALWGTFKTINGNRAVNAILSTSIKTEEQKDLEELKKAVRRNCQFHIYVATDLSHIDFQITDSVATDTIMRLPCTIL